MQIAITGATGFLGAALCHALHAQGHTIIAITRGTTDRWRLADLSIEFRVADITDPSTLPAALQNCDWLIHAAGLLGEFGISEAQYQLLHVEGTRNVLQAAQTIGIKRILHVSSPGVLGATTGAVKDETAPYAPTNRYERSKASAEKVALEFAANGLPIIIARPEFVYGPLDTHVLALFHAIQSGRLILIDGGKSYCHPTYIDDAVDGMLLALTAGKIGEVYHIAGEKSLPMQSFIAQIASALDVETPTFSLPRRVMRPLASIAEWLGERAGVKPLLTRSAVDFFSTSYRFSWQKAGQALGFRPKTDLPHGLQQTVSWYRENGYLDTQSAPYQNTLPPAQPPSKIMQKQTVTSLFPFALAEGEGVGTAYEYFVKRGALRKFLAGKQIKTMLIAGLPQKYGHSSDFFLLAHELGAQLTIIDERPAKLAKTQALLQQLQTDQRLSSLEPDFLAINSYSALDFADKSFDLVISSEVVQRLTVGQVGLFSAETQRVGQHIAIFCPNGDNKSHVGLSGLNGLTLVQLQQQFGASNYSGLIDMPPFPPGIALSQEQRESAESGTLQQVAMYVLQIYSYFERLLPTFVRRHYAHIVYLFK